MDLDHRHLSRAEFFGGCEAAMPGDDAGGFVNQDRVLKAEFPDAARNLVDLPFGVRSGVAWIQAAHAFARNPTYSWEVISQQFDDLFVRLAQRVPLVRQAKR
jgi:hypothetical protein